MVCINHGKTCNMVPWQRIMKCLKIFKSSVQEVNIMTKTLDGKHPKTLQIKKSLSWIPFITTTYCYSNNTTKLYIIYAEIEKKERTRENNSSQNKQMQQTRQKGMQEQTWVGGKGDTLKIVQAFEFWLYWQCTYQDPFKKTRCIKFSGTWIYKRISNPDLQIRSCFNQRDENKLSSCGFWRSRKTKEWKWKKAKIWTLTLTECWKSCGTWRWQIVFGVFGTFPWNLDKGLCDLDIIGWAETIQT